MEKAYIISDIKFEKDYLEMKIDNELFTFLLKDISDKLAKATDQERREYKISPSGYGIHWRILDEDLSINGLLKTDKSKHILQHTGH